MAHHINHECIMITSDRTPRGYREGRRVAATRPIAAVAHHLNYDCIMDNLVTARRPGCTERWPRTTIAVYRPLRAKQRLSARGVANQPIMTAS